MTADEDRITKLEIMLAHQQDLLDALNDVMVEQQRALDKLEKETVRLRELVTNLIHTDPQDNTPPPHY